MPASQQGGGGEREESRGEIAAAENAHANEEFSKRRGEFAERRGKLQAGARLAAGFMNQQREGDGRGKAGD